VADVFVLGSINRDFVLTVDRRPEPGETVTDAKLSTYNGGKGANQAVAAARLGASVVMLGRVGDDDLADPLLDALKDSKVDTSLIRRLSNYRTGSAFISVTPDGENAITVAPGANIGLSSEDVDAAADIIEASTVFVAQMEVPVEVVERAVKVAAARSTRAIVNLAPPASMSRDTLEKLDPLVVNESEAATLIGAPVNGIRDALEASRKLLDLGLRSVVLTLGSQGAVASEAEKEFHVPAPIVDTTGAGDAFVGALAARLSKGISLKDAVSFAVHAGSLAVTKAGAQSSLPSADELELSMPS
jgi:ribokinase